MMKPRNLGLFLGTMTVLAVIIARPIGTTLVTDLEPRPAKRPEYLIQFRFHPESQLDLSFYDLIIIKDGKPVYTLDHVETVPGAFQCDRCTECDGEFKWQFDPSVCGVEDELECRRRGGLLVPVRGLAELNKVCARDLNGDGLPEILFNVDCCYNRYLSLYLLQFGPQFKELVSVGKQQAEIYYMTDSYDINGDGILELSLLDETWTIYPGFPRPRLIYRWENDHFVLATSDFIAFNEREFKDQEAALERTMTVQENDYLCHVYPQVAVPLVFLELMLDYTYFGHWARAVEIFEYYPLAPEVRAPFAEIFIQNLKSSAYWEELLVMDPSLKDLPAALCRAAGVAEKESCK